MVDGEVESEGRFFFRNGEIGMRKVSEGWRVKGEVTRDATLSEKGTASERDLQKTKLPRDRYPIK